MIVSLFLFISGCSPKDQVKEPEGQSENTPPVASEGEKSPQEDENLVLSPLTGQMVPEGTTDRRPLAVMIENAPAARPQSGLDKADVVYEIMAEGGLTRFLAVFLQGDTDVLGPVRSARPYYIERMLEYNAVYAFCGGSPAALNMVKSQGLAALNEFSIGRAAYWRISDRKAPHNLYTDTKKLRQVSAKKGYEKTVKLPEFKFLSKGGENSDGAEALSIAINYPSKYSLVKWTYDKETNKYLRFTAGKAHLNAVTGKQLTGSNILVQYAKTKVIDKEGRLDIEMTGRGKALLFTGGKAYPGTWKKESTRSQTYFYGEKGDVFKLTPGQTWIEVVATGTQVQY